MRCAAIMKQNKLEDGTTQMKNRSDIHAPTGPEISCKSWAAEAPMRMLLLPLGFVVIAIVVVWLASL